MIERRQHQVLTDLADILGQLPARVLLDRMPGPVLGISDDEVVAYANPAVVALLGYDNGALLGRRLSSLLVGRSGAAAGECLAVLRAAGGGETIDWCHADGFSVHTAVSTPLLLRVTDPFLMVYLQDVTELRWSLRP